jgi:hypothetical protein
MVDAFTYFTAGTLLFLFWAYGLVSFVLDIKNKFIPAARTLWQNRKEQQEEREQEKEREERERQLY